MDNLSVHDLTAGFGGPKCPVFGLKCRDFAFSFGKAQESADTEAYLTTLTARVPSIGVVMREAEDGDAERPYEVLLATASAYEFQDYADSGEELLELVPMPEGLVAFLRDFVEEHHEEEAFVKRRRDKKRIDLVEDGRGDARISQLSDVYRAPRTGRPH